MFVILHFLGDEQQSSEDMLDVLSESADEMVENEVHVSHTSDVDSPGGTKEESHHGQPSAEVEVEDCDKGTYICIGTSDTLVQRTLRLLQ